MVGLFSQVWIAMRKIAGIPIWIALILLLSQVFLIYSVEKFLEEDNRFKWPAYISGGLLTLLSISCGLEHIEDC